MVSKVGLTTSWISAIQYYHYKQLSEFNNWNVNSSLRFQRSFPTRTTIIGGVSMNYKGYTNADTTTIIQTDSSATDDFSMFNNGHGKKYGRMGDGEFLSDTVYQSLDASSISQVTLYVRLAQSITQTTGLALQYQTQKAITGSDRFISGLAYSYSQRSQLFDDPMSYEGYTVGGELTQLLPHNMIFKFNIYYTSKKYLQQGIYRDEETYDETTLRDDQLQTYLIRLQKSYAGNVFGVILYMEYFGMRNNSNSYWYNYSNNYYSIGCDLQF